MEVNPEGCEVCEHWPKLPQQFAQITSLDPETRCQWNPWVDYGNRCPQCDRRGPTIKDIAAEAEQQRRNRHEDDE